MPGCEISPLRRGAKCAALVGAAARAQSAMGKATGEQRAGVERAKANREK
jgi:hypothetical protein